MTPDERDAILSRLEDGNLFIAEQVDVPPLYEQLYRWSGGPIAADHCWHQFVGLQIVSQKNTRLSP